MAREISCRERDKLVKQKSWEASTGGSDYSTEYVLTGESWVITKKDFATGRIERFTQDGRSNLGHLEMIQGDPCTKEQFDYDEHHDRILDRQWLYNGETKRPPQTSSTKLVPLPDDMKEDVLFHLQGSNEMANTSGGGIQTRANAALNALLPDHAEVLAREQQENRDIAAKKNAEEHAKRGLDSQSLPQP
jgi:hypothetical protein